MNKYIPLILIIGVVSALIIFGYTLGYQIGHALGEDIIPKERIEIEYLTN